MCGKLCGKVCGNVCGDVWQSVWVSELESKHHAGVVTHGSTRCENFEGLQLECCMLMR